MTLTEFLQARITEAETSERFVSHKHVGAGKIREDVSMIEPSARVLAECEAKRRIVELGMVTVNRLLALPDAHHPDYRDEWRP